MKKLFTLFSLLVAAAASAQTIITPYSGGLTSFAAPANIAFVLENTNGSPITLTGVGQYCETTENNSIWELYYSATSLSGVGSPVPGASWTLIATSAPVSVAANGIVPAFSGLTFSIPGGTQYRFVMRNTVGGSARYVLTPSPNLNEFTNSGVNLKVGNSQIAGSNVGYSGNGTTLATTPRYWHGSVTFLSGPPAPNDAGITAIVSPVNFCPNTTLPVSVALKNFGGNQLNSVTINWEVGGAAQTPFTFSGTLDTMGGTGSVDTTIVVGNFLFGAASTNIVAWTSLPNGQADTVNSNDTSSVAVQPALAGTFTVGGTGADYPNLAAAAAAMSVGGVCGPVVLNIDSASGPYTGQVIIPEIAGASAVNTLTINGNGALLSPNTSVSADRSVIRLDGADHITIDNLRIKPTNVTQGWGIHLMNGADYITISNCIIDLSSATSVTAVNSAGIVASNSLTVGTTAGNTASYLKIINNKIFGAAGGGHHSGINIYGSATAGQTDSLLIEGNEVTDFYAFGIRVSNQPNAIIRGNEVSRPTRTSVTTTEMIAVLGTSPGLLVEKNILRDPFAGVTTSTSLVYPIHINGSGTVSSPIQVSNNLIYNIHSNGSQYGLYSNTASQVNFFHNTVVLDAPVSASTTAITRGLFQTGSAANINIKNNIFFINRDGTGPKHCLYIGTAPSSWTSDNNVLYMGSSGGAVNATGFLSTVQTTLQDWIAASGRDSSSVGADPVFQASPIGNFLPSNGLLNNIGADLTAVVPEDILGNPRTATPDPGILEFTPSANDAGITAVLAVAPCPNATEAVRVIVTNFGGVTLNTVTINWTLSGAPQTPAGITVPIASGASDTVTVGSPLFPAGQPINIIAWTTGPNGASDGNTLNDTATFSSSGPALNGGVYTIGGITPDYIDFASAVSDLNLKGVCGPVTFNIRPGTYTGFYTINAVLGSDPVKTITFQSENGDSTSVIIENPTSTAAANNYVFELNGASDIIFNKLTITRTGTAVNANIFSLVNTNRITFTGNRIIGNMASTAVNVTNGIAIDAPTGSFANNTLVTGNYIGGQNGVVLRGASLVSKSSGNVVTNNRIETFYTGVFMVDQISHVVENNYVIRSSATATTDFYGISSQTCTGNGRVMYNRVYALGGMRGIRVNDCDAGAGNEIVVANNFVQTGGVGISYSIPVEANSKNIGIYYNSILNKTTTATAANGRGIWVDGATTSNVRLLNNNVVMAGVGYPLYAVTAALGGIAQSDHNNFYTNGANVAFWGTAQPTLAALNSVSLKDSNSVSGDPVYNSDFDLTPNTAIANNNALPIPGINDDINGVSRGATPDIGAVEYSPAAVNGALVEFSAPIGDLCTDGSQLVTIALNNLGTQALSNAQINWNLAGPSSLSGAATYSGPLPSLGSDTFSITSLSNLTVGSYTLTVYIAIPGDSDQNNDTLTAHFNVVQIQPAPTVQTGVTACIGSGATLIANGTGSITWYSDAQLTQQIGIGDTITSPPISGPTTFYASNDLGINANIGLTNVTGATSGAGTTNFGIVFDVFTPTTIKSVVIYPVSATSALGSVTIDVINGNNTIIQTATFSVTGSPAGTPVPYVANLNFNIPVGTNYKIRPGSFTGITGLLFMPMTLAPGGNYGYPMSIPGVLTLNHSTLTAAPANTQRLDLYYYFFDWQIGTGTGCPGVAPLTVGLAPAATASFTYSVNQSTVTFTNTSSNSVSSLWLFGDGVGSSADVNPVYNYGQTGVFPATLVSFGPCGDTISTTDTVTILVVGINEKTGIANDFEIFPNPAVGVFNIRLGEVLSGTEIIIMDANGKEVIRTTSVLEKIEIDLSNEPKGLYFVRIVNSERSSVRKLIMH